VFLPAPVMFSSSEKGCKRMQRRMCEFPKTLHASVILTCHLQTLHPVQSVCVHTHVGSVSAALHHSSAASQVLLILLILLITTITIISIMLPGVPGSSVGVCSSITEPLPVVATSPLSVVASLLPPPPPPHLSDLEGGGGGGRAGRRKGATPAGV